MNEDEHVPVEVAVALDSLPAEVHETARANMRRLHAEVRIAATQCSFFVQCFNVIELFL